MQTHDGGVAEFLGDVASLVDLQAKLVFLDVKETVKEATLPFSLAAIGIALIASSLPVALFGAAWLLATALGWHLGWAMLLTSAIALIVAGLATVYGWRRVRRSLDRFRRSGNELAKNVTWIRAVLLARESLFPRDEV